MLFCLFNYSFLSLNFIKVLPAIPHPEVFGLHKNADITKGQKQTTELFSCILQTLPRQAWTGFFTSIVRWHVYS